MPVGDERPALLAGGSGRRVNAKGETGIGRGARSEAGPMAAGCRFRVKKIPMKTSSSRASQRTDSSTSRRSSAETRRSGETQFSEQREWAEQPQGAEVVGDKERRQSLPRQRAVAADAQSSQEIRETVAHEEIARRAYELWEQDGCPEGRSEQHWSEAERQLRGSSFSGSVGGNDARAEARAIKPSAERRANASAQN